MKRTNNMVSLEDTILQQKKNLLKTLLQTPNQQQQHQYDDDAVRNLVETFPLVCSQKESYSVKYSFDHGYDTDPHSSRNQEKQLLDWDVMQAARGNVLEEDALEEKNMYPLLYLVRYLQPSLATVRAMCAAYPEAMGLSTTSHNSRQTSALIEACYNVKRLTEDVFVYLVEQTPMGVFSSSIVDTPAKNKEKSFLKEIQQPPRNVLFLVCGNDMPKFAAQAILRVAPQTANGYCDGYCYSECGCCRWKFLPLHLACWHWATLDILKSIYEAAPEAGGCASSCIHDDPIFFMIRNICRCNLDDKQLLQVVDYFLDQQPNRCNTKLVALLSLACRESKAPLCLIKRLADEVDGLSTAIDDNRKRELIRFACTSRHTEAVHYLENLWYGPRRKYAETRALESFKMLLEDYNDSKVQAFVKEHPEVCREKIFFNNESNKLYALPLLVVACLHPSLGAIQTIYHAHPEAVETVDEDQAHVLHQVAYNGASLEVYDFLLSVAPTDDFVNRKDLNSDTPLHYLCRLDELTSEAIELFVKRGADASIQNRDGYTPLHLACEKLAELPIIQCLAVLSPVSCVETAKYMGTTPLALCIKEHSQDERLLEVVKFLVTFDPAAITVCKAHEDQSSMSALHIALSEGAPPDIVGCLVEAVQDKRSFVQVAGEAERTPLMYALEGSYGSDVIQMLVSASPESVTYMDESWLEYYTTAMHIAVDEKKSLSIIELMLRAAPEVLDITGYSFGTEVYATPFEMVLSNNDENIVKLMLSIYPQAVLGGSDNNSSILRHAMREKCSYLILEQLVNAAIHCHEEFGDRSAFDKALQHSCLYFENFEDPGKVIHMLVQSTSFSAEEIDESLRLLSKNSAAGDVFDFLQAEYHKLFVDLSLQAAKP